MKNLKNPLAEINRSQYSNNLVPFWGGKRQWMLQAALKFPIRLPLRRSLSLSLSGFKILKLSLQVQTPDAAKLNNSFLTVPFSLPSPVSTLLSLLPLFLGFHRSTPSIPCNHMALPSSESKESYCRKQKSLGLLCTKYSLSLSLSLHELGVSLFLIIILMLA